MTLRCWDGGYGGLLLYSLSVVDGYVSETPSTLFLDEVLVSWRLHAGGILFLTLYGAERCCVV